MNEIEPSGRDFWRAFAQKLGAAWSEPHGLAKERFVGADSWSDVILGSRTGRENLPPFGLLGDLGRESFGFKGSASGRYRGITSEHFRVDQCWWSYPDATNDDDWSLAVAIEHENAPGRYVEEIHKMLAIRCRLRVVIGYPFDAKKPDLDGTAEVRRLDAILRIAARSVASGHPQSGDLLLILGHRSRWKERVWRALLLIEDGKIATNLDSAKALEPALILTDPTCS